MSPSFFANTAERNTQKASGFTLQAPERLKSWVTSHCWRWGQAGGWLKTGKRKRWAPFLLPAQRRWALSTSAGDGGFTLESFNRVGLDWDTRPSRVWALQRLSARNTQEWTPQAAWLPAPFPLVAFRPPWFRLNLQAGDWRIPETLTSPRGKS